MNQFKDIQEKQEFCQDELNQFGGEKRSPQYSEQQYGNDKKYNEPEQPIQYKEHDEPTVYSAEHFRKNSMTNRKRFNILMKSIIKLSDEQYDEQKQPIQQSDEYAQPIEQPDIQYDEYRQPIQYCEQEQSIQHYDSQYDKYGQPIQYDGEYEGNEEKIHVDNHTIIQWK
ncbi:hypothetical protein JTB14_007613 [Gonioctena quinquepunctata]|nr:hypothetical protein JTB14_007613 [Gonioctena quinquepunctata]